MTRIRFPMIIDLLHNADHYSPLSPQFAAGLALLKDCLLYTSDAADE